MPGVDPRTWERRTAVRVVIIGAIALFVIGNLAAGLLRGSDQAPAARATDAQIESFIRAQVADAGYPGAAFAIVRDGQISHSGGIGRADSSGRPVGPGTPFVIGSLSKAVTATAVMQLVEAGRLELDAPVSRYITDFSVADGRGSQITVRHLLHHTSGLPTLAANLASEVTSVDAQVASLAGVTLSSDPGAALTYSNANYLVLGRMVERASGQRFGDYVAGAIFGPLGMDDSHSDYATARADGLTDAHRFWFGLAQAGEPLWRPDFVPAGWLIASADDLGRFVAANLNGGALDGQRILSPTGVAQMHTGAVTYLRAAYGMGWIDGRLGNTRIVSHTGSTTDMSSAMYLAPDRGLGIVMLFNGQSVIYELLHKPDAIAEAAFAQMMAEPAGGTLALLYPAFDIAVIAMVVLQLRSLWRVIGNARRGEPTIQPFHGSRFLGIALAVFGRLLSPLLILWTVPEVLGAPWEILVQIDLGQVLAAYVVLQLANFVVTVAPTIARLSFTRPRSGEPART